MLANFAPEAAWWFMEVPRTGTSTLERTLRHVFEDAKAVYAKHWPVLPPPAFAKNAKSVVSVRNPYSRAVSCWQYFTVPGKQTFVEWLQERKKESFFDIYIEARPQHSWLSLQKSWDFCLRQEHLQSDFWSFVHSFMPDKEQFNLHRYNDINGHWVNRVRQKTSRPKPWESYFCPESIELVSELYREDLDYLSNIYEPSFPGKLKAEVQEDAEAPTEEVAT